MNKKTKTPLRGVKLAKAVMNQILKHPETWNQSSTHSDCGSTHCFMGWVQLLGTGRTTPHGVFREASQLLGEDYSDISSALFSAPDNTRHIYLLVCKMAKLPMPRGKKLPLFKV